MFPCDTATTPVDVALGPSSLCSRPFQGVFELRRHSGLLELNERSDPPVSRDTCWGLPRSYHCYFSQGDLRVLSNALM